MSSRLLTIVCIANSLLIFSVIYLHFSNSNTVVYVDSQKVINQYQGMVEARMVYQAKVSTWKLSLDSISKQLNAEIQKFQDESAGMSAREKDLTRQLILSKQQQFLVYQKSIQEKADSEDDASTRVILEEINSYIRKYGEEHNYTMVLAATEYGNIAYAKNHVDISQQILEGLNDEFSQKKLLNEGK